MTTSEALSSFVAETTLRHVPARVRSFATIAFLDAVGCGVAGRETPIVKAVEAALEEQESFGRGVRLLGSSRRLPAMLGALVNALAINALDFDDTFELGSSAISHPGSSTVGAALTMVVGRTGAELLAAIIVGYEVAIRVALAVQPSVERRSRVWGLGTHQAFGAAAATAKLLGLDANGVAHAFGLAACHTSVPSAWLASGWVKDAVGWPAMTGVLSARLARQDFRSPARPFDGRRSYYSAAGSDGYRPELIAEGLGSRWRLLELSLKPYPACRWTHAALDAVASLRKRVADVCELEEIVVAGTWELSKIFARYEPQDLVDAQFSLPYLCAMVWLGREPGPQWADPSCFRDQHVLAVARKVRVLADEAMERRRAANPGEMGCVVTIVLRDGRRYSEEPGAARGSPHRPLSDAEVATKFQLLAGKALGEARARASCAELMDLAQAADAEALLTALSRTRTE